MPEDSVGDHMGTLCRKFKERDPHNQSVAVAVLLILANVKVLCAPLANNIPTRYII